MRILTQSGGLVEVNILRSSMIGTRCVIHIDQTANIRNGEEEASIDLNIDECKSLISGLNEFIRLIEGQDHVVTTESVSKLLSIPRVQEVLKALEDEGVIDKPKQDPSPIKLMR